VNPVLGSVIGALALAEVMERVFVSRSNPTRSEPMTLLDVALILTAFLLLLNVLSAAWQAMKFTAAQLRMVFFSRDQREECSRPRE
jgi:hypothetical protein